MLRLAIALFMLISLPRLWTFGQFMDGIIYTSIARNMAEGYGTFWKPYASDYFGNIFYHHPPLSMWCHSVLYRLFGDLVIIDSLWSFFCGCLIIYFAFLLHNKMNHGKTGWFPVVLTSIMPMSSWLFSNNLLEAPVTVTTLVSTLLQIHGLRKNNSRAYLYIVAAGGFLALGILFKNIACLFPLIIPMTYCFFFRSISFGKALVYSFSLCLSVVSLFSLIIYAGHGTEFYGEYLQAQLLPGVLGTGHRENPDILHNLNILISELILPLLFSGLILIFSKKLKSLKLNPQTVFFLILGISATMPLYLIHKFRGFYIYPGLTFLALSIASFFNPSALRFEETLTNTAFKQKILSMVSALVFILSFALLFFFKDKPYRLKEFKHDILEANLKIPERSQVYACNSQIMSDYTIEAAFQRYLKVSLVPGNVTKASWLLQDKKISCAIPGNCHRVSASESMRYNLFSCRH